MKNTCVKKYNVDHPFKSDECTKKRKETWLKKYGKDNPNKDQNIVKKGYETRLKVHKFKDTDIFYQGSYEFDFLNKFYDSIPEIKRDPTIKYKFKNKQCLYFLIFIFYH